MTTISKIPNIRAGKLYSLSRTSTVLFETVRLACISANSRFRPEKVPLSLIDRGQSESGGLGNTFHVGIGSNLHSRCFSFRSFISKACPSSVSRLRAEEKMRRRSVVLLAIKLLSAFFTQGSRASQAGKIHHQHESNFSQTHALSHTYFDVAYRFILINDLN